jgi:hypothetical protein
MYFLLSRKAQSQIIIIIPPVQHARLEFSPGPEKLVYLWQNHEKQRGFLPLFPAWDHPGKIA